MIKKVISTTTLTALLLLGIFININAQTGPPIVDGLFYAPVDINGNIDLENGIADSEKYPSEPYALSAYGSELYVTLIDGTLYAALVVDPYLVNDNVFDRQGGQNTYPADVGWGNRFFKNLVNSEFAEFRLTVGDLDPFVWLHGYADVSEGNQTNTIDNWISGPQIGTEEGTPPPGLVSASSLMWNMNNYANNQTPGWDMNLRGNDTQSWISPYLLDDNNDPGVPESYPGYDENNQWEWSMVYEWSVDLTQFGDGTPVFVLTGSSHHSPLKNADNRCDDNLTDCFPPTDPDPLFDFGDLPSNYPTLLTDDGARHIIDPNGALLGSSLDNELDGQPSQEAKGDDGTGVDDEDGITFLTPLTPGENAVIEVTAGTPGYLSAFIDFNNDGTLQPVTLVSSSGPASVTAGTIGDTHLSSAGVYELTISVPSDATGPMYSRFRYTNNAGEGGNSITGEALSGEVEDYALGAIGDYVWFDENADGIQDATENGVENVFVTLLDDNENVITTTTTDSNGFYLFSGLPAGTYIVNFEAPSGFDFTLKGQGSDPTLDSDANFSTGNTDPVTLLSSEFRLDIDAGLEEVTESAEQTSLIVTEGSCWRMFSSPFQTKREFITDGDDNRVPDPEGATTTFTYNDFVGPWWTQGPTGSQNPDLNASNANIFVWPLDATGNVDTDWSIDFGTDGLDEQVTAARGFLMSVFADDDPSDGIDNTWPVDDKERIFEYINEDVWGFDSNNPEVSTDISAPMNTTSDGWSLVGNPYDEAITFNELTSSNITGVAYVYDRNLTGTGEGVDVGDNIGGWRTTNTDDYGDITSGVIEPFQAFFVQNNGSQGTVTFTDGSKQGVGEFYGKKNDRSFIRLTLSSDQLFNSAWITFSDNATFDRMYGDAYELNPFTEDYALFGTQKGDELFDIGQFPFEDGTEIPLVVETTLSGEYTISATDFEIPSGTNLVFVDNEDNVTIPVDENFSYTFKTSALQKKGMGMEALPCGATEQQIADFFKPQKAKSAGTDRFSLIVNPEDNLNDNELPNDVQLKQNYPNPFNPTTQITYQLPQQSDVRLEVYDMAGRQVATLLNDRVSAGTHTINFDAADLSSGVYLYRLQAGSTVLTKKLTLIK